MTNRKEQTMQYREKYSELNESFSSELVFHLGESAGFYSEYNCMILAMLYCLQHKIQFKLYSKDANFKYNTGWTDYFEPFCKEETSSCHQWINMRPTGGWKAVLAQKNWRLTKWNLKKALSNLAAKCWKMAHPNTFLTQDVWGKLFTKEMKNQHYAIPQLGINGSIVEACNRLVELTWVYSEDVKKGIAAHINSLCLPPNFSSCQIRGGDKIIEADLLSTEPYLEKFKEYPNTRNIFVLTDEYSTIQTLRSDYPQWNWYTLCQPDETGYVHDSFKRINDTTKKERMVRFFASMEAIHFSDLFIGTITSNPSIFAKMRDTQKSIWIDTQESLDNQYYLGGGGSFFI